MTWEAMANIFQGITTLTESFSHNPRMAAARIGLILLGFLMIYLGKKGYLEALLMIPMGLGMATVNAACAGRVPGRAGGIVPGDRADLVLFDFDPQANHIAVRATYLDGRRVF